jgi:hypothetical protein
MLNEQGVSPALTVGFRPRDTHLPFDMNQLTAVVRRTSCGPAGWARIPVRPSAALREASRWIGRTHPADACFEPDPFVSEQPFLCDRWPFD